MTQYCPCTVNLFRLLLVWGAAVNRDMNLWSHHESRESFWRSMISPRGVQFPSISAGTYLTGTVRGIRARAASSSVLQQVDKVHGWNTVASCYTTRLRHNRSREIFTAAFQINNDIKCCVTQTSKNKSNTTWSSVSSKDSTDHIWFSLF